MLRILSLALLRCIGFSLAMMLGLIEQNSRTALAQTPAQNIQRQQQIIIQQQEQQMRALEKKRKELAPPSDPKKKKDKKDQNPVPEKTCIDIDEITVGGAEKLPVSTQREMLQKFEGQCLSLAQMNDILRVLTNWYIDEGFITTRAYLPEQDLKDGALKIAVVEGRTEDILIHENGKPRQKRDTAFPRLKGKRLNIRDIEQGLDQINRLPSIDAQIRLEPGSKTGGTELNIDTSRGPSVRVSIMKDNFGIPSTGENMVNSEIAADDLLGLYDSLVVTANQNVDEDAPDQLSESLTVQYSVPYGYWTFNWLSSFYAYENPIRGLNQRFVASGRSTTHKGELSKIVHRDQKSKTRVSGFLEANLNLNYIEDTLVEVQSRRLSSAGVSITHSTQFLGGALSLTGGGERGVRMFDALEDDNLSNDFPRAQFAKLTAELSFWRPFEIFGQRIAFDTYINGQWAPHSLYSTERMSIGGQYTVRGFIEQSIFGDIGAYMRNELIWSLPSIGRKPFSFLGQIDLFAAYDMGWIQSDSTDVFERGTVRGVAGGVRAHSGPIFAEASWEKPISKPDFFIEEDDIFRFRVGVSSTIFH